MSRDPLLVWGSTSLIPDELMDVEFSLDVSADGTTWGNPEAVVTAVRSQLQDGSLARVDSYENRTATVSVVVESLSYDGLARGEAALMAEANVDGYSTLRWAADKALMRESVLDVVYATVAFNFNDLDEIKRGEGTTLRRYYSVTFECLPFARSVDLTTVQVTSPPAASPTTMEIANGSTTTGWTIPRGGSIATSPDGNVNNFFARNFFGELRWSGTIDTATTRVMYFEWAQVFVDTSGPAHGYITGPSHPNGVEMTLVATGTADTGQTRTYFRVPASFGASATSVSITTTGPAVEDTGILAVRRVVRTNQDPSSGTFRQRMRSLVMPGSARTPVSLAIKAPAGDTLGRTTLVYTRTSTTGLQPPLRPWRVSSASVATDAGSLSGGTNSLGTAMTLLIPANRFNMAAHQLAALLTSLTVGTYTINWSATVASATGADVPESTRLIDQGSVDVTFPTAGIWMPVEIDVVQLPPVVVAQDSTLMVRLVLVASSSQVFIDEAWLFDLDNGVLSWVESEGLTRLEIRTADLTNPEPSYWGGYADGGGPTGLVRCDWRVLAGQHIFDPGPVDIFTATTGTLRSSCDASFYERSHTHIAPPEAA